jgi:hypothetical protein
VQRIAFGSAVAAAVIALSVSATISADTVAVGHRTSAAHGLLTLRSMDGRLLARGEQVQAVRGNIVTKRLTFRFNDGSLDDETTEFTDRGELRLISYHHVQKGPSFQHPLELDIDATTGHVIAREMGNAGYARVEEKTLPMPEDLSNGLLPNIVENVRPAALPLSVSYLAATPKLRLVRLVITSDGIESLATAGARYQAQHYVVDVRLGGFEGVVSSAIRKRLPQSHIWINAAAPTFLRAESPLGIDGPMWRIELTSPAPTAN